MHGLVCDILGWTEIIHTIHPDNAASIALAKRLGSDYLRQEPTIPPFEGDVWDVYGQSADEWRARRN